MTTVDSLCAGSPHCERCASIDLCLQPTVWLHIGHPQITTVLFVNTRLTSTEQDLLSYYSNVIHILIYCINFGALMTERQQHCEVPARPVGPMGPEAPTSPWIPAGPG